jgi:riboflavin kinase/FMN adenylyltransferase
MILWGNPTMKIFTRLNDICEPFQNAVVTVGNFDGVHVGHQSLFQKAIEKAKTSRGTAVVVTFEPHPVHVLRPSPDFPLINTYEQKVELIRETGMDVLICVPFTPEFAAITPNDFIKKVLCHTIGMRTIIVGPNHTFGRNKEGNIELLKELGAIYGFEVIVSDWDQCGTRGISSSTIRNLIVKGKVEKAARLMGRHYKLRGKVIHGHGRGGGVLGIPTANIVLGEQICPKTGVYVVTVEYNNRVYGGVANIGHCPTFHNQDLSVEVHLFALNGDIYDRPIQVNFVKRLRGETRFPTPVALAKQIKKDIQTAHNTLNDAQ